VGINVGILWGLPQQHQLGNEYKANNGKRKVNCERDIKGSRGQENNFIRNAINLPGLPDVYWELQATVDQGLEVTV
jgi:hypothetical protein